MTNTQPQSQPKPTTSTAKLCIHCKHHQQYMRTGDFPKTYHFCGHPTYGVNLVTGEARSKQCGDARSAVYGAKPEPLEDVLGHCGPHGQLFEARTSAPISIAAHPDLNCQPL